MNEYKTGILIVSRRPTKQDKNEVYKIGEVWLYEPEKEFFVLVDKNENEAIWVEANATQIDAITTCV